MCVCVQTLLTLDHCIGIIGGRPRHSVYFVGFQGKNLSRTNCCTAYFHNMYCGQNITQQLAYYISATCLTTSVHVYALRFSCADDKLLNLDPHYCQAAVSVTKSEFDIRTYHCNTPRKLTATKMDPSCAIGFFCRDMEDFYSLRKKTEPVSSR